MCKMCSYSALQVGWDSEGINLFISMVTKLAVNFTHEH